MTPDILDNVGLAKHIERDISFTRWLFWGYLAVLFLVPLPLGSNRPFFWGVFVASVSFLALVWSLGWLSGVARWPGGMARAKWVFLLLGGFVVWGALKVGWGAVFYQVAAEAPPTESLTDQITIAAEAAPTASMTDSIDALLLSFGYLLLGFLTVVLVRSTRRALVVLQVLLLAGLFQAIYGSLMMLSGVEWGFFAAKEWGRGLATGTFVNRNHYANLLVLSLSAGIGLMLAQMDLRGAPGMRQRLRSFLQATLGPKARLRIFLVVIVIALVLTRSRMGNASFFAALTMVGMFSLWRLRERSRPLVVLVVSVLVIDVFVIGTWFGVEQVIDRLQKTVQVQEDQWVVTDRNRVDVDRESLDIISKKPLAGWGGGTFYTVYPPWRGADQRFMDHAHNDYLEFVIEYGIVGGLFLAGFILLCLRRAALGLQERDRARQFGLCFASLMAMVAMLIHAAVDFNLQIPANGGWFVVFCLLPFAIQIKRRGAG